MTQTLSWILDEVSRVLLLPCLLLLCLLALGAVLSCGAAVGEFFCDRRWRRLDETGLLLRLHQAGRDGLAQTVAESGLSRRHQRCLTTLIGASLPRQEREILADKLLADQEALGRKALDRVALVVRLGPMAGLLGTLIPLGPGIVALGQGDTAALSQSLQTAFNTTIVGVAAAGLAYVVSVCRRHWYRRDSALLESLMECCLEELEHET